MLQVKCINNLVTILIFGTRGRVLGRMDLIDYPLMFGRKKTLKSMKGLGRAGK